MNSTQNIIDVLSRDSVKKIAVARVGVSPHVSAEVALRAIRALLFPDSAVSMGCCAALSIPFAQAQEDSPQFPVTIPEGALAELRDLKIVQVIEQDAQGTRVQVRVPAHLI